mmetsp:Transcript_52972/g.139581  ORF Transcript_52972/g.139581 Transcript_52972/m.139581 type:complete len:651 (-) Transcript_52972:1867-3819(-)
MGVSFFGPEYPDDFMVFDRAFLALFRITAGDTWVPSLPVRFDNGSLNWRGASFVISYIMIVNWIILQVSVAVLLDNFINASHRIDEETRIPVLEGFQARNEDKSPLAPLIERLARNYHGKEDLSKRLGTLFKSLDSDRSGYLSSQKFCEGIRKLDFKPRIYVSDSDFVGITKDGALCNQQGLLGPDEFERVMREQIRIHTEMSVSQSITMSFENEGLSVLIALKHLMMEQQDMKSAMSTLRKSLSGGEQVPTLSSPVGVGPSGLLAARRLSKEHSKQSLAVDIPESLTARSSETAGPARRAVPLVAFHRLVQGSGGQTGTASSGVVIPVSPTSTNPPSVPRVIQHHTAPDIVKWLDEKVRGIESEIEQSKGTNLLGAGAETDSDGAWRAAEQGSKEGSKQSDETSRPSDKAATSAKSRKKTKDHQPRSLRRLHIDGASGLGTVEALEALLAPTGRDAARRVHRAQTNVEPTEAANGAHSGGGPGPRQFSWMGRQSGLPSGATGRPDARRGATEIRSLISASGLVVAQHDASAPAAPPGNGSPGHRYSSLPAAIPINRNGQTATLLGSGEHEEAPELRERLGHDAEPGGRAGVGATSAAWASAAARGGNRRRSSVPAEHGERAFPSLPYHHGRMGNAFVREHAHVYPLTRA